MQLVKNLSIIALLALLSGCGLKYDLYMPEDGANGDKQGNFLIYSVEGEENSATNSKLNSK